VDFNTGTGVRGAGGGLLLHLEVTPRRRRPVMLRARSSATPIPCRPGWRTSSAVSNAKGASSTPRIS
jgi:hypothetical protein